MAATAAVLDIGQMITSVQGIHGGRPIITGTGVTVRRIAIWYKMGLTAEEIATRIGHLTVAQVYAALTYYHVNREAIETDIAEEDAAYERLMREHYANQPTQP